jgi:hypothetical protein
MERRFARRLLPWQPRGFVTFSQHAIELFGQFHGCGDVGRKGTEGLREALLGGRGIVDEAEQEAKTDASTFFLLILKNGTREAVTDYWLDGGYVEFVSDDSVRATFRVMHST